ncbi:MAG: GNAT family N-acetyltransferase [Nanoarchaeota archaeon]|nr:GNAT family N-acetyltransferase [Nanoarchaeota archaeon]
MLPEIEIKRPNNILEVGDFVDFCADKGYHNTFAPGSLDEGTWYLIAVKGKEIVGGVGCIIYHPDSIAELDTLVVDKSIQGQGLEDALLGMLLSDLKQISIGAVRVIPNQDEESFYSQHGFLPDQIDESYMIYKN